MFRDTGFVKRSTVLEDGRVMHGFATRSGGVSQIPAVAAMNLAVRMGDSEENVRRNMALFATYSGMENMPIVCSRQIHSSQVRYVTAEDALVPPEDRECDGYVTDVPEVALLVRAADCLPILFRAEREDGGCVIAAVHAGWRGTVSGIAANAVAALLGLGAMLHTVRVAIGPGIGQCCFEVKDDFCRAVTEARGADFAAGHIIKKDGGLYADLKGMNVQILNEAGVSCRCIDVSPDCTAHMADIYHSHRATGGNRGVGGGMIGIVGDNRKGR